MAETLFIALIFRSSRFVFKLMLAKEKMFRVLKGTNYFSMSDLTDMPVHIRFRLSALWTSLMLCYIYCDYFHLFVPGHIESLIQGKSVGGPISPAKLVAFAVMMSIPALMVALSLILPSRWSRMLNIAFGILYTLIMIAVASMSIGEWYIFYSYFALIEIALSVTITIMAWRWPKTV